MDGSNCRDDWQILLMLMPIFGKIKVAALCLGYFPKFGVKLYLFWKSGHLVFTDLDDSEFSFSFLLNLLG